jgi:transcription-repair coupling factor (superfamily II helicase)
MALRSLLTHLDDSPDGVALQRDGGRAFVSQALRPYVVAALADADPTRPTLVVAGDDRQARDLAADVGAWLAPRRVRFYPSRGVTYESHLAPPPHLVGLRVAALDALLDERAEGEEPPVVVVSAVALSEKVPDPSLRPHGFTIRKGDLLDLGEIAEQLVAMGYVRGDQVEDRGQFAIRGEILDLFPATSDRAVRVDLFDIEVESLREFSTFTQRSFGDVDASRSLRPPSWRPSTARWPRSPPPATTARIRPDIADVLPVDRFHAFLDLAPATRASHRRRGGRRAGAARPLAGRLRRLPRRRRAPPLRQARRHPRRARRPRQGAAVEHLRRPAAAVPRADRRHRCAVAQGGRDRAREAHALAVPHGRGLGTPAEGERAAYNLARVKATWDTDGPAALRPGPPARRLHRPGIKLAVLPDHRLLRRRRDARTGGMDAGRSAAAALRSFADLRTGDIIVHEDHGLARFAGFDTKTVGGVTRDYLNLEYAGTDKVFLPVDQLAKISRYVGAGGSHPPLSKLGGKSWEAMKTRARRAAQELAGELLNLYAERKRRSGFGFPEDSEWLQEFEAKFPYQETPDQREAIELVKATWRPSARWTASSAATSATARPRSPCAPRSRPPTPASRCSCSSRRRSSPSSTTARSPSA